MYRLAVTLFMISAFYRASAVAEISDPSNIISSYNKFYLEEVQPQVLNTQGENEYEKAQNLLKKGGVSPKIRSALLRYIALNATDTKIIGDACRETDIQADDFVLQTWCVSSSEIPNTQKRKEVGIILDNSIAKLRGTNVPSLVGGMLLDIIWADNDIVGYRTIYKKVMDVTPRSAKRSILLLKEQLASAYTSPGQSTKLIQEGINILDDIEAEYRRVHEDEEAELIAYNKGIFKLLGLDDYAGALREFQKITPKGQYFVDSKIFSALSLSQLRKNEEASKILRDIDLRSYTDQKRLPFLNCYMSVVKHEINQQEDLGSCVKLPIDTQWEVVLHLTKFLSRRHLGTELELGLWRQFWHFYTDQIVPQKQTEAEGQINAMEFETAKLENQVKDLELKNFQKLKIVFTVTLAAFLMGILFFFRLSRQKAKVEKLQTYIHKSVLNRFLPPTLVDEIINGKSSIESDPREVCITVLFADMVNFTALSGQLGAGISSEILNRFMRQMTEVIFHHGGTIDKFMGDAVMVLFGAPVHAAPVEQTKTSIACAREMLRAMDLMNEGLKQDFQVTVDIRIGINQGPAIVGTFGSEKRSDYTAIGPTVNLASRIEGKAHPHEIMISPEVAKYLHPEEIEQRGLYKLKGVQDEIMLFAVKSADHRMYRTTREAS